VRLYLKKQKQKTKILYSNEKQQTTDTVNNVDEAHNVERSQMARVLTKLGMVAHACNPNYSGGTDLEDCCL
jgi:hypothetical protein